MTKVPSHAGFARPKRDIPVELFDIDEKGRRYYRIFIFGEYKYLTLDELKMDFNFWWSEVSE